jgi:hypothetical protein
VGIWLYRSETWFALCGTTDLLVLADVSAVLLLGIIVLIARPEWPTREGILDSCATGVFMHALYLGGVYISIANGLPAALSALIVGLQPLLTSTIANRLLGEQVVARQWGGPNPGSAAPTTNLTQPRSTAEAFHCGGGAQRSARNCWRIDSWNGWRVPVSCQPPREGSAAARSSLRPARTPSSIKALAISTPPMPRDPRDTAPRAPHRCIKSRML